MGKTIRRVNYEITGNTNGYKRRKTHGSKVSAKGYYTQVVYDIYNHPTLKVKDLVYNNHGYFGNESYKWVETDKPFPVYVPNYLSFDIHKFYKQYYDLHGDNHSGDYNVPKWYRKYKNKRLNNEFKKYLFREIKGLPEGVIPKFVHDAYWDYS